MRTTLADAKNSRIPKAIGVCATEPRFLQILNEAQSRLITRGHWWGCVARFRFCAQDSCITLPRSIACIEGVAVCNQPIALREMWYEFLEGGFGIEDGFVNAGGCCSGYSCHGRNCILQGRYPTFGDIVGTNKKVNLVCDASDDVGKQVLILGYDENLNWIRTSQGGVIKDGELVALAQAPGTISNNFFTQVTDIQVPDTLVGQWWLFEYNNDTTTLRQIGHYQYDETRPSYQRYKIPGLANSCSLNTSPTVNGGCVQTKVDIIAKLDFIPAKNDTDYLVISNLDALKAMCGAINKAENTSDSVASNMIIKGGLMEAEDILNQELDHYLGSGRRIGVTVIGSSVGSIQPVINVL